MAYLSRFITIFGSIALLISQSLIVQARPGETVQQGIVQQVLAPPANEADIAQDTASARPFYAIAHRVLMAQSVRDALRHGANAVEIDMTAWKKGWWADHDGTPTSAGDTARKMFETIAEERKVGKTLNFVWLDIKNPDWCDPADPNWRHCSIDGLRDLARELLEPHGVRVLYGFYDAKGKAWKSIRDGLNANEAINLNGKVKEVEPPFTSGGPAQQSKRVMSYGYYNLAFEFGNCNEASYYTCTELRQGVASGKFGKVFGWTSAQGQASYVDRLLGDAGIDGLIYGFKATYYYDHKDTRAAAQDIFKWLTSHADRRYLAGQHDSPW